MTFPRALLALSIVLCACEGSPFQRAQEVRTFTLDYITAEQAAERIRPYLSREGEVFRSKDALNTITVRDDRERVSRIRNAISDWDAAPETVTLNFQVVRASQSGTLDPALRSVAGALREVLRFDGYELIGQALVTATERRSVDQRVVGGEMPLHLGVKIQDVRSTYGDNGSVDLTVELRGAKGASLLSTNVVIPMGQTVVLGSAYPGESGDALILTVRPQIGARNLRAATTKRAIVVPEREFQLEEAARAMEHLADTMAAMAHDVSVRVTPRPPAASRPPVRARADTGPPRTLPAAKPPGGGN